MRRAALLLPVILAGCAASQAVTPAHEEVPPPQEPPQPQATQAEPAQAPPTAQEPEPAEPQAPVGDEGPYCPVNAPNLKFAGFSGSTKNAWVLHMVQRARPGGAGATLEITQDTEWHKAKEQRSTAASYHVSIGDGELIVALVPDRTRAVPGPVRELTLPPRVGDTWSARRGTGAVTCTVDAIESVRTYAGERARCARVRFRDAQGITYLSWYDPQLGLVRTEARLPGSAAVYGLALCEQWPDDDKVVALFR